MIVLHIPVRTSNGLNSREHWQARAKRVRLEREATAWVLRNQPRPEAPCTFLLTRIAPSMGLDDDNLPGALKAVRDQIAAWMEVDDRSPLVAYRYAQARGPWGVTVAFEV